MILQSLIQLNTIHTADCLAFMPQLPDESVHLVIADPPYFRVQLKEAWDNQWPHEAAYLDWSGRWMRDAMRLLVSGGLLYCFGQTGKREQVWLHLMARACCEWEISRPHHLGSSRRLQRAARFVYSGIRNDSGASQRRRAATF